MAMYAIRIERMGRMTGVNRYLSFVDKNICETARIPMNVFTLEEAEALKDRLAERFIYRYSVIDNLGNAVKVISYFKEKIAPVKIQKSLLKVKIC